MVGRGGKAKKIKTFERLKINASRMENPCTQGTVGHSNRAEQEQYWIQFHSLPRTGSLLNLTNFFPWTSFSCRLTYV